MNYLITTEHDSLNIECCLRNDVSLDKVIYWDDNESATGVFDIGQKDYVVLAIRNTIIERMVTDVIREKGVIEENICYFYKVYNVAIPFMRADRVMSNPYYESYECLVLGLSHAEVGIIADNLCAHSANLAVSSQDLFYNYHTLKYVIEKYKDKLRGLKYIVIDMYKYNYFNFDTSLSRMAGLYWSLGGYNLNAHHFSNNINYTCTFDELIYYILKNQYGDLSEEQLDSWNRWFYIDYTNMDKRGFDNIEWRSRDKIIDDESVNTYNYNPSNTKNRFDDTIKENIEIFDNLLGLIMEFNPQIKVFVIQMPMYEKAWDNAKRYYEPWKKDFEAILNKQMKYYHFQYYDWIQHELSTNKMNWYDVEHLNYLGALRFTDFLNDVILRG